jgi:hypothetical protein
MEDVVAIEQEKILIHVAASSPQRDEIVRNSKEGVVEKPHVEPKFTFLQLSADAIDAKTTHEYDASNTGQLQIGKLMLEYGDAADFEEAFGAVRCIWPQPLPTAGCQNESLHALQAIQTRDVSDRLGAQ